MVATFSPSTRTGWNALLFPTAKSSKTMPMIASIASPALTHVMVSKFLQHFAFFTCVLKDLQCWKSAECEGIQKEVGQAYDEASCKGYCREVEGCNWVSYNAFTQECFLYSTCSNLQWNEQFASSQKQCGERKGKNF